MKYVPFITSALLILPVLVSAQTLTAYEPLVGIPGFTFGNTTNDLSNLINALYALSISIAALLAVIKIVIAGVKYMMTDVVTSKGDALKDIRGALIGLIIVVAAVMILTVINPLIVNNP